MTFLNLDVADGLTNGPTCVVKHIEYRTSQCRPAIIWVLFKNTKIGISRRNQYRHLFSSRVDGTWTPIFEVKRTFIFNKKTYERVQFPLQASAGKTIHKAQGATLSNAVINLTQTKHRKIPHIHYVALSRVKSLDGLFVLDFNEKSLDKDDSVDEEMDRLRQKKKSALLSTTISGLDTSEKKLLVLRTSKIEFLLVLPESHWSTSAKGATSTSTVGAKSN